MNDIHNEFLRKFLAAQQSLFAYIRAYGYGLTDAEDLLQETAVALWKSYAAYNPALPFQSWALGVTRNLILKQYRHDRMRSRIQVDSAVCERLAECVAETLQEENVSRFSRERDRMKRCLQALPEKSQELLRLRYEAGLELPDLAERLGRSYAAANMLLTRIRRKLLDCVASVAEGARP